MPGGGLGRFPWGPGRSWGGWPGGVAGRNYKGRWWLSTPGLRIKIDVDFDVVFWSSWARFRLRLGEPFGSFSPFCRAKLVPRPSSNRFIFEKANFHETLRFPMVWGLFSPEVAGQNDPRSLQDGSEIVLDRFFGLLLFRLDFGSLSAPFWCRFGCPNRPEGWHQTRVFGPWGRLGAVPFSSCGSGSPFWSSWAPLGFVLGAKFGFLGRFGAFRGVVFARS